MLSVLAHVPRSVCKILEKWEFWKDHTIPCRAPPIRVSSSCVVSVQVSLCRGPGAAWEVHQDAVAFIAWGEDIRPTLSRTYSVYSKRCGNFLMEGTSTSFPFHTHELYRQTWQDPSSQLNRLPHYQHAGIHGQASVSLGLRYVWPCRAWNRRGY